MMNHKTLEYYIFLFEIIAYIIIAVNSNILFF